MSIFLVWTFFAQKQIAFIKKMTFNRVTANVENSGGSYIYKRRRKMMTVLKAYYDGANFVTLQDY